MPEPDTPVPERPELPAADVKKGDRVLQLGHYSISPQTVEYDLAVQERYQSFSAELLRISLLGLGAIGIGFTNVFFPSGTVGIALTLPTVVVIALSLIGFAVSAAAALVHRYASVDSLSWHIQSLRRDRRNAQGDSTLAETERRLRYRQFVRARYALGISTASLGLAAAALAAVFLLLVAADLR